MCFFLPVDTNRYHLRKSKIGVTISNKRDFGLMFSTIKRQVDLMDFICTSV